MIAFQDVPLAAENFETFSNIQFQLIAVLFMVGYGAHFAFSTFFLASSTAIAPKYRIVPWLSAVVMIAAGLSLFREHSSWTGAFEFTGTDWVALEGSPFSNAFRYANWTITIPLLLGQLMVALNIARSDAYQKYARLVVAALLMVWTGLIGQFYEATSTTTLWIWFAISTAFFIWLLVELRGAFAMAESTTPNSLHPWLKFLFAYMLVFWSLYAVGYIVPAFSTAPWALFSRQLLFTIADLTSKLIYGVILSRFVMRRSALEGHVPSIEALGGWPNK